MKNIALVAALVFATTTASVRVAAACGGTGQLPEGFASIGTGAPVFETALTGAWPRMHRERDGRTILALSYPHMLGGSPQLYMDRFEVVRDRNLRRLERVLAHRKWPNLDVSIERVDGNRWRVTGWAVRA